MSSGGVGEVSVMPHDEVTERDGRYAPRHGFEPVPQILRQAAAA